MTPVCRTCSQPIVRGAYLPWTHVAPRPGRGHYAYPAPGTFVDPRRPGSRPTQNRLEGAGASNRGPASPESPDLGGPSDSQPVGASAPERRSPGLASTG